MGRVLDVNIAYRRTFYFVAGSLTPSVSLSKAGGSFNASTNAVVEIANGFYYLDLTTTETNTVGDLAYSFGSLGLGVADPDNRDQVGQLDVNVVACGGLAVAAGALPNAAAGAANGLLINGTNTTANVSIGGLSTTDYGINAQGNAAGSGYSVQFGGGGGLGNIGGFICAGAGSSEGLRILGSGTGHGLRIYSGGSAGNAVNLVGQTAEALIATAGGSNKDAVKLVPTGTGFGINGTLSAGAPTAAAIATAIFQDTTAGDFTVSGSIGASLFTGGNVPGATGGLALVGSNVGAATSVSGAVGSVTGAVGSVTGSVGSVAGVTFPTNFSSMVISAGGLVKIQSGVTKNAAIANFPFIMSLANVPKTGLTVAAKRSIDGAAYGDCANAVAEVANGQYKISLAAADLNGTTIELQFTATGADPTFITILTTP